MKRKIQIKLCDMADNNYQLSELKDLVIRLGLEDESIVNKMNKKEVCQLLTIHHNERLHHSIKKFQKVNNFLFTCIVIA